MSRADDHLEQYRQQYAKLHAAALGGEDAYLAHDWAVFAMGFLYGAGLPAAAATLAYTFRKAFPGEAREMPALFEGEV